jgi:RHS repeat-associated protein
MARTAPAPNLIAIPGMNPGTWLMGGGAGGGGAGGGDGNGDDGAGGAGGENDGQNGDGNGNGAGSCGQGGAGACTNCASKTAAGDPIDVVTGEVFTGWKTDLFLPGFFNLDIRRKYSTSTRARDIGLGHGWIHSLAWEIHEEGSGLVLHSGDGRRVELPLLERVGDQASKGGWAILRIEGGYVVRPGTEFFHIFGVDPDFPHIARLVSVSYRGYGSVRLSYVKGQLQVVTDTAGRRISFDRGPDGRIERLVVPQLDGPAVVFARYLYSASGDLVQVTDADGFVTRYTYDDDHRLTAIAHPTGLTYHFRYDERGRGIETWGDYGDQVDVALSPALPTMLADDQTPARGVLHARLTFFDDGTSEVVDSQRFHRYFAAPAHPGNIAKGVDTRGGVSVRHFDEHGQEIALEDPAGAVWTWEYDQVGCLIRETDAEGHTTRIERDAEGRVVGVIDPLGGSIQVARDAAGDVAWLRDQRGGIAQHVRDDRGRLLSLVDRRGAQTSYAYDAMGNVVEVRGPRGEVTRFTYDYFGRELSQTDALGATTTYRRTLGGALIEMRDAIGRRTSFRYDGLGQLVEHIGSDGVATRFVRGGDGWITAALLADGREQRWLYNREGWLVDVINEKAEHHLYDYDADGRVTREVRFDGTVRTFRHDSRGRTVAFTDVDRGTLDITRNLLGQIVEQTTPNGEVWAFDYDGRGELVGARGPEAAFAWIRDPAGDVVQESFSFDGCTYVVDSALDANGDRVGYRTSLGHELTVRRDQAGDPAEAWADGKPLLRWERDQLGATTRRVLPGGAAIVDSRDAVYRLRSREVEVPRASSPAGSSVPDWVGQEGVGASRHRYEYAPNDEIVAHESSREGLTEYSYDLRRHLRTTSRDGVLEEEFDVDATGNHLRRGEHSVVAAGNRLVRSGDTEYVFDAGGFLCERRRRVPDAGVPTWETTRYLWNDRQLLSAIELPGGRRVAFTYDAYARRLAKTESLRSGTGEDVPVRTTHYVWDLVSVRHEVVFTPDGSREVRTFAAEQRRDGVPFAQRDGDGEWAYFVSDVNGAPQELVDGRGVEVGSLTRDVFGKVVKQHGLTTDVRAPGQLEDVETGLFYNRFRYYDPELGRYLSPDPIGLEGGLNLYAYGLNPVGWFDPMGWHSLQVDSGGIPGVPSGPYQGGYPSGTSASDPHNTHTDLQSQATCHSERKMLRDLEAARNNGADLRGRTVTATGEFPPCPQCHRMMQKFASENGMNIEYQWNARGPNGSIVPQSISYPGGDNGPTFNTIPATDRHGNTVNLEDAYAMEPSSSTKYGYRFTNNYFSVNNDSYPAHRDQAAT